MTCPHCTSTAPTALPKRTARSYRPVRCAACRRQFNERTGPPYTYLPLPTDSLLLVVMWRLRYNLRLRDLAARCLERGCEVPHAAVREWEVRFAPLVADKLRTKRTRPLGRSWHVHAP